MAAKLLPFPVFTSDSNFLSSTLLVTIYISIGYVGDFSRYRGSKFKNSKLFKWVTKTFHLQFFDIMCPLWPIIIWPKNSEIGILKKFKSHFCYVGTEILRSIFAISRRCHVPSLISPERGEQHPSNFQDTLSPHHRFRRCTAVPDQKGYVCGEPRKTFSTRV